MKNLLNNLLIIYIISISVFVTTRYMINKYPSQDNTNNDDIQNKNGADENTNDDILLKNGGNNNVDETGNARADLDGLNIENVEDTFTTKRHLLIN